MAYSDYGGYAYKNGERVEERSDAVLSPEGIKSTPGMWPGWVLQEGRSGGSYHALIGDGPIFVGLYKQSTIAIYRLGEQLNLADLLSDSDSEAIKSYEDKGETRRYVDSDYFLDNDKPCIVSVDGCELEIRYTHSDNYYVFARLTQPDGNVWHGWSGYGVGAGLEDGDHGYSTSACERTLWGLFPYTPTPHLAATKTDGE